MQWGTILQTVPVSRRIFWVCPAYPAKPIFSIFSFLNYSSNTEEVSVHSAKMKKYKWSISGFLFVQLRLQLSEESFVGVSAQVGFVGGEGAFEVDAEAAQDADALVLPDYGCDFLPLLVDEGGQLVLPVDVVEYFVRFEIREYLEVDLHEDLVGRFHVVS
jgi:hypothetical protein